MKYRFVFVAAILLLIVPVVSADSLDVVTTGDATWHGWQTPSTAQVANAGWDTAKNVVSGTAFWNNWSIDGTPNHQCSIGYWLSGTGGCTAVNSTSGASLFGADSPNTTASYLGNGKTGFKFTPSPDTTAVQLTMHVQVSMFSAQGTDEFGWFDTTSPGTLNPLFGGRISSPVSTPRGSVATFIPSGSYGFYLNSPTGTYLSTGVGDSQSHFAVFQLPGTDHYMFGLEDLNDGWLADWDYNDLAIEMQALTNVPEPATMVLLGSGLLGVAAARRRRQR